MQQFLRYIRTCLVLGSFRMNDKGIQSNLNSELYSVIKESSQTAIEALD